VEPELIYIPIEARGHRLGELPMSVRLTGILKRAGHRVLGDLHGRSYVEILKCRNCGATTIAELRQIVARLQRGNLQPAQLTTKAPTQVNADFVIAESIRSLQFADLPISQRLAGLMSKAGMRRVGDLSGRSQAELLNFSNCGRRTLREISTLISRAEQGEFATAAWDARTAPAVLVRLLDAGIAKLDNRHRNLLLDRIGARELPPQTLEQLGQREGLTRERIRQILERKILQAVRKSAGPEIPALLLSVKQRCLSTLCPLTPELLSEWLNQQHFTPAYRGTAYLRLLMALEENMPAWPQGHDGGGPGDANAQNFSTRLTDIVFEAGAEVSLPYAYRQLRTLPQLKNLDAAEFLRRLRATRRLTVTFANPESTYGSRQPSDCTADRGGDLEREF
jgi:hypothetical protein